MCKDSCVIESGAWDCTFLVRGCFAERKLFPILCVLGFVHCSCFIACTVQYIVSVIACWFRFASGGYLEGFRISSESLQMLTSVCVYVCVESGSILYLSGFLHIPYIAMYSMTAGGVAVGGAVTTGASSEAEVKGDGAKGEESINQLDEAMKEIQASIDELPEQPTVDGSDDESDSEDEEEGGRSFVHVHVHM